MRMFGEEEDMAMNLGPGASPYKQLKSITHITSLTRDSLIIP